MKLNSSYFFCLTFMLLSIFSANAQSVSLDSVFVVADRLPAERSQLTSSVTVIDAETIAAMPVNSVDELLRGLPGVNINSRGGFGTQADIGIRGTTFSQVLVLVDGRRINDPLTAHFNNTIPVPLGEIERIEVIRGAGSTAYGADAVGGVIHIHTKTFSEAKSTQGLRVQGDVGLGEFGLIQNDLTAAYGGEKAKISVGMRLNSARGEERDNVNYTEGGSNFGPAKKNADFHLQTYTLAGALSLTEKWTLLGRGMYTNNRFDAQHYYTRSGFDESRETTDNGSAHLRLAHQGKRSKTWIDGSLSSTDDLFVFNPLFVPNFHRSRRFLLNADRHSNLRDGTHLSYGLTLSRRDIRSTDRGDHEDDNSAVYLLASKLFADHWRAMAGVRAENDSNFGMEIVPEIGLSYFKKHFTFRVEVADAVRGGDYTERYISDQIPALSDGRNLGNPALVAERSRTFSLGGELRPSRGHLFSADGFVRRGKEMIDYQLVAAEEVEGVGDPVPGNTYFQTRNLSEVETFGVELVYNGEYALSENGKLRLDLGYTWTETKNPEGAEASKYLANHPSHQMDTRLSFTSGRLTFGSHMAYFIRKSETVTAIGAHVPEAYGTWDAQVGVNLGQGISLYAKGINLLDREYQEILGAQMPGRWLMGGLRVQLNGGE